MLKKKIISKPKISIITVVYNADKTLERCFKSLYKQKNLSYEHIVIDGGSTDNTLKIIKKYKSKIKYWTSKKDKGIYDAFNKGMKVAKV